MADFYRTQQRSGKVGGDAVVAALDTAEARQDLDRRLAEAFDLELLELAKVRVKARIDSTRWRVWEMTAVEQIAGELASEQLNMKLATVYSTRSKVQQMIRDEVELLDRDSAEGFERRRKS